MQTLRKKNSPCKFKNDPTRFLGEGVSFKAKLIGILEVSEARGDRMCQAALADLKMAIRAAGEHKQRIAVQVSIDGLRLRDEKTGDCLYHHPVHKISFIAQDMSDSRAFGYIFGSPDTGHRFFGIKTDKAASQVVIAMRDLFQVVFELKKKEIELAKQHIEQNAINAIKFHTGGIFVESAPDTKGAAGTESSFHRIRTTNCEVDKTADRKNETQSGVIADLLDLQFELNSLQQGIHQMDKITPENPVPSTDDLFETDPFGDSFANMKLQDTVRTVRPILPPPPSSTKRGHLERQHTVPVPPASTTSSPATTLVSKTPPPQSTIHWFDKEAENLFNDNEMTSLSKNSTTKKDQEDSSVETTPRNSQTKSPQIDVFTELDPLGTGLIKPYVDKKDFFQHLKNPPKKVLKDLVSTNSSDSFPTNFNITTSTECMESTKTQNELSSRDSEDNFANFDRFDENEASQSSQQKVDSPKKEMVSRSIHHQPLSVSLPPEEATSSKTTVASGGSSILRSMDRDSTESTQGLVKLPSPKKYIQSVRKREFDIDLPTGKAQSVESNKQFPVDFSITNESPASPLRSCSSDANSRLSSSSAELDLVPEPPPRGAGNILINPPPLPPKKQGARGGARPPPRPPHTEGHFQYDFPQRDTSPSPTKIVKNRSPPRDIKGHQFDDNFSPPPQISSKSDFTTTSAFEDSFSTMISSTTSLSSVPFTNSSSTVPVTDSKKIKPPLDITLSQLTSSWTNLDELASSLGMTVQQLTSLTLTQLTQCLTSLSAKETVVSDAEETPPITTTSTTIKEQTLISPKSTSSLSSLASKSLETTCGLNSSSFVCSESLKTDYESETKQDPTYDKYAVFRELLEMEQMERKEETKIEETEKEEAFNESEQGSDETEIQPELQTNESTSNSISSLVNLTVKLPVKSENLSKEESMAKLDETMISSLANLTAEKEKSMEVENKEIEKENDVIVDADVTSDSSTVQPTEVDIEDDTEKTQTIMEAEEKLENSEKGSDANGTLSDKVGSDILNDETNGSSVAERSSTEVKSSISTSSDRYAALREIIGEPEPIPIKKDDEEIVSSARTSPVVQIQQSRSLAEVELLNLFSDLPPPSSPNISAKKDSEDLKAVAMDIFEEIKMLNTGTHRAKETKSLASSSGFEDMFCPFAETRLDKDDNKEDSNWAKFDTGVFGSSDRSSCEGQRSIGGTSPWSPDGKDFHREIPFKGSGGYRHSGDSDNEWKDEEESEESNGRLRGDGRYWSGSRHPRFDAPGFEDRSFYEDTDKRDRSFRDRMGRKSRGAPWTKIGGVHRPRDPSPWHEESQWEDEGPRRYPHRKVPYKDDEEQYEAHWKCRSKLPPPQRCNWSHDVHGSYYDDERKRKLMLWNEEDRFGSSQESMGYDEEDRWSRRRYERRRWEEDNRLWCRRGPPDADYSMREAYYYYRDSRERPHDYPSWDEEYGPERPGDDSPRYNPAGRKRHWPKRPNSANDGRNSDMIYTDPRKFGASRSECSDNDSDPYLRPSQRSRSRESYWGSDQEYDSWVERPYWSEGPDSKSETMHRKRIARHKTRQVQKTQSPFEDDFAQSVEHMEASGTSGAVEPLAPVDTRIRLDAADQKREVPPASPSSCARGPPKDYPRRDIPIREYSKRSSYFEDDLTPTASASSDASDRQRLSSDLKATPEELPCDTKDPQQPIDGFVSEDSGRDSFFNGDLRFDDDAFVFKSELDDNVPDHRATTLPLKNTRQGKYGPGNNNNNNKTPRGDQYIRKSESVNIFARESDPFDGDDFFN